MHAGQAHQRLARGWPGRHLVNGSKPPTKMTWRELADEIDQANRRAPGPWTEEEWNRFMAVASEFVSRIRLGTSELEAEQGRRLERWRMSFVMALATGFAIACALLPLLLVEGR